MRIRSTTIWLVMCLLIVRIAAANETIDIFDASTVGLGVWSCHDANISLQDDKIVLGQNNPTVKLGKEPPLAERKLSRLRR